MAITNARRRAALAGLLAAACLSSCSREREGPPAGSLWPVQGTATYHGEPARKAMVVLRRVGGDGAGPVPHGVVGKDGKFRIGTYGEDDGAPPGEYVVTVTWPKARPNPLTGDEEFEDRLEGRFSEPLTSPLKATVKAGDNQLPPFKLD